MKITKFLGIAGLLSPLMGFTTIIVTVFIHEWFSWKNNALSDLGALTTSYSSIYNIGMILTGLLGILFVAGLFFFFKSKISLLGSILFFVGMIFLVLVGVFPSGTSPHLEVSLGFFASSSAGILLIGIGESLRRNMTGYAALITVIVGIPSAFWAVENYSGAAIPETVGAICFSVITIFYGTKMFREGNGERE